MKLKLNELRIYYEGEINEKLYIALWGLLDKFDYSMQTAWRDHENHVENLTFIKR